MMTAVQSPSNESGSEDVQAICDAFERAWQNDDRPQIERFLDRASERQRPELLIELVRLEVGYRRRAREAPQVAEYVRRFPGYATRLSQLFSGEAALDTVPFSDGTSPDARPDGGPLHVRCPHCQSLIDCSDDRALRNVRCQSCGGTFDLAGGEPGSAAAALCAKLGHFHLLEMLGAGAFGTVWKAQDTKLDRIVAIKLPHRRELAAAEAQSFLREARAAARLRHPNIVAVHEVGLQDESVYIVSEFIEGPSLADWLRTHRPTARTTAELCARIAEALHIAHQAGVIHRDLKPANILLDAAGEPHLADFGLARRESGDVTVTLDGRVLGTPAYMSPEQSLGEGHRADRRTDVYSLGVILFELLTGERPFQGNMGMLLHKVVHEEPPSPRKLSASIPRDLETICLKCLQKQPEQRYSSASELARDLRHWLKNEPISARPAGRLSKAVRWGRRNPTIVALAVVLSALILALGTILRLSGVPGSGQRSGSVTGPDAVLATTAPGRVAPAGEPSPPAPRLPAQRPVSAQETTEFFASVLPAIEPPVLRGLPHTPGRASVGWTGGLSCTTCHYVTKESEPIAGMRGDSANGWIKANEVAVWSLLDQHYQAYALLLTERAQTIARELGVVDENGHSQVHRDLRCLACHTGEPLEQLRLAPFRPGERGSLVAEEQIADSRVHTGVHCEGCHGAAGKPGEPEGWLLTHINPQTWRFLDSQKKFDDFGLFNLRSQIPRTRLCLACHLGSVRSGRVVTHEMLQAGHPRLGGFEIETFQYQQPPHWRPVSEKTPELLVEYEKRTGRSLVNSELSPTRRLLVGQLVTLSTTFELIADLNDADVPAPIGAPHGPHYAQFDCETCHADRADSPRHSRIWKAPRWSQVLARIAMSAAGFPQEEAAQELSQRIAAVERAATEGNIPALVRGARAVSARCYALAELLERRPDEDSVAGIRLGADVLLAVAEEAASSAGYDFDSARQLTWALAVVYDDFRERVERLPFLPSSDDLGWYPKRENLDEVQTKLADLEEMLSLDLRSGIRSSLTVPGESTPRPLLLEDSIEDQRKRDEFDPQAFRRRMAEIRDMIQ